MQSPVEQLQPRFPGASSAGSNFLKRSPFHSPLVVDPRYQSPASFHQGGGAGGSPSLMSSFPETDDSRYQQQDMQRQQRPPPPPAAVDQRRRHRNLYRALSGSRRAAKKEAKEEEEEDGEAGAFRINSKAFGKNRASDHFIADFLGRKTNIEDYDQTSRYR